MGKNLIQQARGKGSPTYKSPSFRFVGKPLHPTIKDMNGKVEHLIHCQGHTAPLAHVVYEDETPAEVVLYPNSCFNCLSTGTMRT